MTPPLPFHFRGCPAIADDESDYEHLADAGCCACGPRPAAEVVAAFRAGYHAQWIRDERRWIFDPAMKPGDPDGALEAWLLSTAALAE